MDTAPSGHIDYRQYQDLFEGQSKKIDCSHELVFNVSANLYKSSEELPQDICENILIKNYHIPVKEDANTKAFMDAFFNFLENCLASSAKHAYENTPIEKDKT